MALDFFIYFMALLGLYALFAELAPWGTPLRAWAARNGSAFTLLLMVLAFALACVAHFVLQ